MNGIRADKWVLKTPHGTTGSMNDVVEFYYDSLLEKPVAWHMHSRNKIYDSHTDEYVVTYISFTAGAEPKKPAQCREGKTVSSNSGMSFPLSTILPKKNAVGFPTVPGVSLAFKSFAAANNMNYHSEEEW